MRRNTEAFERFVAVSDRQIEAFDRQAESFDRQAEAFDRQAEAFDRQARSLDHQESVMRVLVADLRQSTETFERRTDAVIDTLAALAAEIRGWRSESGPGSA